MSQINQFYWTRNAEVFTERLDPDYQVYLCSPHASLSIVILSRSRELSDALIPQSIADAAHRAVSLFNLNPSQVVWVEYLSPSSDLGADGSFQLIQFDWQAGQATHFRRSPIREGWYLSWLQGELYPSKLRQALESMLVT